MTAIFAALFFAAPAFAEQDFQGLDVGAINPLNGALTEHFRAVDIDGDGANDLVLPHQVRFQRDGRFPQEAAAALPAIDGRIECDTWTSQIYYYRDGQVTVFAWAEDEWHTSLEQPINIDVMEASAAVLTAATSDTVTFARFLYDLDGDGVPEIVRPREEGLQVYVRTGESFSSAGLLDVYPTATIKAAQPQALWPADQRQLTWPTREMNCRLLLKGSRLTTLTQAGRARNMVEHHVRSFDVNRTGALFTVEPVKDPPTPHSLVPTFMAPCHLNADAAIDYAGRRWSIPKDSLAPVPVHETFVSTDAGATIQSRKSRSFPTRCSFIDYDYDGDADMITEHTDLFDGNIREFVNRYMTLQTIAHEIRIYLQDGRAKFSASPDALGRFTIELTKPPIVEGPMFTRYRAGGLVHLNGDFNADGYCDIVIQDRRDRVALHMGAKTRLDAAEPEFFPLPPNARVFVTDVDDDGRSDILIRWSALNGVEWTERGRVLFAREEGS